MRGDDDARRPSELAYSARVTRVDPVAKRRVEDSPSLYFEVLLELESTDSRS